MSRFNDLVQLVYFRPISTTDDHGSTFKDLSIPATFEDGCYTLSGEFYFTVENDEDGLIYNYYPENANYLKGSLKPQTLTQNVENVGQVISGDILVYVPLNIQPSVDVREGDVFIIDNRLWYVSNIPFKYRLHTVLLLKNRVEYANTES